MIRELIDTDLEAVAGGFDVNQYLYNYQTNSVTQSASATSSGASSPATAVNAVGNQINSATLVALASHG
jgi:hypothetical protein